MKIRWTKNWDDIWELADRGYFSHVYTRKVFGRFLVVYR